MPYLTIRKPQRSFFNNFYEDLFDYRPSYSVFEQPSTYLVQRRYKDPFEELFSTFNDEFFQKSNQMIEKRKEEENSPFEVQMKFSKKIPKENIKVEVEDDMLTIKAEFKDGKSYESYSKKVTIPSNVDIQKISAKFNNGKLQITIPKVENNLIEEKKEENVNEKEEKKEENVQRKEEENKVEEELIIEDLNEEEKVEIKENEEKLILEDSDIYGEEEANEIKNVEIEIPKDEKLKDITFQ